MIPTFQDPGLHGARRRAVNLAPLKFDGTSIVTADLPTWASLDFGALGGEGTRRVLNVVVAFVALVVLLPVMALVALLVWLSSPGPVIYRQTRVGVDRRSPRLPSGNWRRSDDLGGRPFTMYKFRTMYEADQAVEVWATPDDPRVTPLGRILRQFRLDELPQLVNVLKGDMNIVGPRPEQPSIFAELREQVPGYEHRQRVLPGITGWAQVSRPYDTSVEDVRRKVELDLEYINRTSVAHDFLIMLQTVPVLIGRKGAW